MAPTPTPPLKGRGLKDRKFPPHGLATRRRDTELKARIHKKGDCHDDRPSRSEEHTSELQSLMRNTYAVFCLKKKNSSQNLNHVYRRRRLRRQLVTILYSN